MKEYLLYLLEFADRPASNDLKVLEVFFQSAYSFILSSSVRLIPDAVKITFSSIYRSFISAYASEFLSDNRMYLCIASAK